MEDIPGRSFGPETSYKYVGIAPVVAEFLCWNHVCFPSLCLYVDKKWALFSMRLSCCLAFGQNALQGKKENYHLVISAE